MSEVGVLGVVARECDAPPSGLRPFQRSLRACGCTVFETHDPRQAGLAVGHRLGCVLVAKAHHHKHETVTAACARPREVPFGSPPDGRLPVTEYRYARLHRLDRDLASQLTIFYN